MGKILARLAYELNMPRRALLGLSANKAAALGSVGLAVLGSAACAAEGPSVQETFYVDCPEGTFPVADVVGDGQKTALSPLETHVKISCSGGETPVGFGLADKSVPEDPDWSSGLVTVTGKATRPFDEPAIEYKFSTGNPAEVTLWNVPEWNTSVEVQPAQ